jgi:hypothetical protein
VSIIVALVLTAAALVVILAPVFRRRAAAAGGSAASVTEWQERYRSSLADLQDAEMDWQIGNLSDADYALVRTEQRRRAAEALKAVSLRETILAQVRAESRIATHNGVAAYQGPTSTAVAELPLETAEAHRPPATALPAASFLVGGAAAIAAVVAVALLYFRLMDAQAGQRPFATLPIEHAHAVVIDQAGLWVGHHGGLLRSADGQAWRATSASGDIMSLVTLGSRRFAFGHDVLLASDDGGSTWVQLVHDLPGTDVHGAQVGSGGIYAYVIGFGLFRSEAGARWDQVGPPLGEDVGGLAVLSSASGADTVFLNAGGIVARSADGGRTWGGANGSGNLALNGFVNALAADSSNGLLYAGTTQGLFRSSSGGADWARLPFRGAVTAIGADANRIAVVDDHDGFFISTDGGGTWTGGS